MRRWFTYMLILVWRTAIAQSNVYHPLPDSNAIWCEQAVWGTTCAINEHCLLRIDGDTVISQIQYHKIVADGHQNCLSSYAYFNDQYRGAMRQDTAQRKVYWVDPALPSGEFVLYDFTLGIGDTTPFNGLSVVITSIDSVLIGSDYRKRWWGTNPNLNDSVSIVEGIGSSRGLYRLNWQGVEYFSHLNSFEENSVLLFVPDSNMTCQVSLLVPEGIQLDEVTVYPNPGDGEFTIYINTGQEQDLRVELADVTGRVVSSARSNGSNTFSFQMGSTELADGVYFVRVITNSGVLLKKVVVQKSH